MLRSEVGFIDKFLYGKSSKLNDKSKSSETSEDKNSNDDSSDESDMMRTLGSFLFPEVIKPKIQKEQPVNVDKKPIVEEENNEETVEEVKKPRRDKNKPRRTGSKVSRFKREEICRAVFENYFDDYFPTCRPKFLANPDTGRPLELDGYNASKNLAWEHQGAQHRAYPNHFHKSREEFEYQQKKDQFKKQRLAELGIDLIEIPDLIPENKISDYIISQIKRLGK